MAVSLFANEAKKDSVIREQKYQALFGEKPLGLKDQKDLNQFLSSCDVSFASRNEAATYFSERAWEYLGEGRLDTAAFRFNYVNALNPLSVDAYWGLGVISFQRRDHELAIKLLEKGLSLDTTQSALRVDLATVKLNCFQTNLACGTPQEVEDLLAKSILQDPKNANAWMKRAQAAYYLGDIEKAWTYFHECRQLDILQLDINFSEYLLQKMPDPKGFFKLKE
jgi:tetratricopeptide (TPR) repeat protein